MKTTVMQCVFNHFKSDANFVAIKLTLPHSSGNEIIINPKENFDAKLEYYKNTYDVNGVHKHVPDIRIIGWADGNTFQELQERLKE